MEYILKNGEKTRLEITNDINGNKSYLLYYKNEAMYSFTLASNLDPYASDYFLEAIEELEEQIANEARIEEEQKDPSEPKMPSVHIIGKTNSKDSHYELRTEDTEEKKSGVYLNQKITNNKTGGTFMQSTRICTPIYIAHKIASERANFYKVVIHDRNKKKNKIIRAKDLFLTGSKNSPDFDWLIDNGLKIEEKCRSHVLDYLKACEARTKEFEGTEFTGWKDGEYISNGINTSDFIFTGSTVIRFERKGDAEEQKRFLKEIFTDNTLAYFIFGYCYGGYFSKFLMQEMNQMLGIIGKTTGGKSTIGRIAVSGGTNPLYYQSMNSTKLALSAMAKQYNDAFIFFDEIGESSLKPEERLQLVYSLANASERNRMHKIGDNIGLKEADSNQAKYSLLFCGEESLLNAVANRRGGTDVRLCEIILDENTQIFENITDAQEIEAISYHITQHYGHILPLYIEYLKEHQSEINTRYLERLQFVRSDLGSSGKTTNRKARILAYTYIACEILTDIIFDEDEKIKKAIVNETYLAGKAALFKPNSEMEQTTDIYKDILNNIEYSLHDNFIHKYNGDVVNENLKPKEMLGYVDKNTHMKKVMIFNTAFTNLCVKLKIDNQLFLAYLHDKGLLDCDKGTNQKKIMVDGQRARFYSIRVPYSFFDDKENDAVPLFPAEEGEYTEEVEEQE